MNINDEQILAAFLRASPSIATHLEERERLAKFGDALDDAERGLRDKIDQLEECDDCDDYIVLKMRGRKLSALVEDLLEKCELY